MARLIGHRENTVVMESIFGHYEAVTPSDTVAAGDGGMDLMELNQ